MNSEEVLPQNEGHECAEVAVPNGGMEMLRAGMHVQLVKALPANQAIVCLFNGELPDKDSQAIYANDKTLIIVRKMVAGMAQLRSLTLSEALLSLVGYQIEQFAIRTLYDGLPKQFCKELSIFSLEFIEMLAGREKEFLASSQPQQKGQLSELKVFSQMGTLLGTTYRMQTIQSVLTTEVQIECSKGQLAILNRPVPKQPKEVRSLVKKIIGS